MLKFLNDYKGGIIFILVCIVMFFAYMNRIEALNSLEKQTNISFYE